jgi:chaperonin GroES
MKLEPLYHNVLVRPFAEGDRSSGGLLIPAIATRNSPFRYGEVVSTGEGRINAEGKVISLAVKAGDIILFVRNAGTEIPIGHDHGEELLVMIEEKYIAGKCHDMPQRTSIMGFDGRLLEMTPQSRTLSGFHQGALSDSSYKNQEELDRAQKDWGVDTSDHEDETEATAKGRFPAATDLTKES